MAPHPTLTRTAYVLDAAEPIPLAVWACAQTTGYIQRARRYLPESTAHPGKMLPEFARRITAEYAPPGGLVVDPMCGIGTTLVEAAIQGRRSVGVELEPRWAGANLGHARGAAYLAEMAIVYAGCFQVLRPGGLLVTVTRNLRRQVRVFDLAGATVTLAEQAGYQYLRHVIALLAAVRDSGLQTPGPQASQAAGCAGRRADSAGEHAG